jgi:hypothetical protein
MVLVPVNCFNPDFSFRPQFKQNCGPVWGTLQIFYNMRDDVKFISFNRIVPVHCFHFIPSLNKTVAQFGVF